jgi:hypothetical protein
MKQSLANYLGGITEKTAIVFCSDCICLQNIVLESHISSFTFLGSMIDETALELFWQSIQKKRIKEIIIAGHCECEMMNFMMDRTSDKPNWEPAKGYMKKLAEYYYPLIANKPNKEKELLRYHISKQIKRLAEFGLKNKTIKDRLTIRGVLINDENNFGEVEHIGLSVILEQLPFYLN